MALRFSDYTVAWLCALDLERAAAEAMLDETHQRLLRHDGDDNIYTFGRMGQHNVVIASLPAGYYGESPATRVATNMQRTFGNGLELRLCVGIAGAGPSFKNDLRLGDVVVSKPDGTLGGVVQYDRGKHEQGSEFVMTRQQNRPPEIMLQAVVALEARYDPGDSRIKQHMEEMSA